MKTALSFWEETGQLFLAQMPRHSRLIHEEARGPVTYGDEIDIGFDVMRAIQELNSR